MKKVNPNLSLPLPQQIKNGLLSRIRSGRLKPDERIPSETDLARESGVSRITARQALLELINEGLLYRTPGKGTFVAGTTSRSRNFLCGSGRQITLITPNLTNPFYHQIIQGVEQTAEKNRYEVIIHSVGENPLQENTCLEKALAADKQGLILTTGKYSVANLGTLQTVSRKIPLVIVDVSVPGLKSDLVVSDNVRGAFLAVEHLIELGRRRILHLAGPAGDSSAEERLAGYRQALGKSRIAYRPELVRFTNWQAEDGYHETKKFYLAAGAEKAAAIFAANDETALGAFRALAELKIAVPDKVALVGFGNFAISRFLETPLTTVDQSAVEMGRIAGQLVMDKMSGLRKMDDVVRKTIPTRLVIRQSCGIRQ